MQSLIITFSNDFIRLHYPCELLDIVQKLPGKKLRSVKFKVLSTLYITPHSEDNYYRILCDNPKEETKVHNQNLTKKLTTFIINIFLSCSYNEFVVQASIMSQGGKGLLIPGIFQNELAALSNVLINQNYQLLSNSISLLSSNTSETKFLIDSLDTTKVEKYDSSTGNSSMAPKVDILSLEEIDEPAIHVSLILFLVYKQNSSLSLNAMKPREAALEFIQYAAQASSFDNNDFSIASTFARLTPALRLTYGDEKQLQQLHAEVFRIILQGDFTPTGLQCLLGPFQNAHNQKINISNSGKLLEDNEIPSPTPSREKKKLTIGMTTFNDYDGVYFSIQAIRMYHHDVSDIIEIIVVDNNPTGPSAKYLKQLEKHIDNYRYIPYMDHTGTAVRDLIFRHANSDNVLVIDCHVLLEPGGIKQLIEYFDSHAQCIDLLQGPILSDNLVDNNSQLDPVWKNGMYGCWEAKQAAVKNIKHPFEIGMQGLGLFSCRKEAWVGLNSRFRGFGGEEGYLHKKFEKQGGKIICLPFLKWLHRFDRPGGSRYAINWEDRVHNYLVGSKELKIDPSSIKEHFVEHLGEDVATRIIHSVENELASPFYYFDAIYFFDVQNSNSRNVSNTITELGLDKQIRYLHMEAFCQDMQINRSLAHREILFRANQQNLNNVLILENQTSYHAKTFDFLARALNEVHNIDWNIFYLGGIGETQKTKKHHFLSIPAGIIHSSTIAYNSKVFETIIAALPNTEQVTRDWLSKEISLDNYLTTIENKFMINPSVSCPNYLLEKQTDDIQKLFTIKGNTTN